MKNILMLNMIVSVLFLTFVASRIIKRATVLNTFSFSYVASCCLGLSFLQLFPDLMNINLLKPAAVYRAVIASLLCQTIIFVFLCIQNNRTAIDTSYAGKQSTLTIPKRSLLFIKLLVLIGFVLSFIFILYWFFFSDAHKHFMKAFLDFGEAGAYYSYRNMIAEEIVGKKGQGAYIAKRIMLNLGPLIMVFSAYLYKRSKNLIYLFIVLIQAILGLLVAGVYSHKSSLTLALVFPFISLYIWNQDRLSKKAAVSFVLFFCIVFGITLFLTTGNTNFIQGFFRRAILVPAHVSTFYFGIFPDVHEFRGWLEMFYMNRIYAGPDDISIHEVGKIISGKAYGANASFIAVAYSGLGMYGVFFLVILLSLFLLTLDRMLSTYLPERVRFVCVFLNIPGLIAIVSGSLMTAVSNGYLMFPIITLFLVGQNQRKRKVKRELTASNLKSQNVIGVRDPSRI